MIFPHLPLVPLAVPHPNNHLYILHMIKRYTPTSQDTCSVFPSSLSLSSSLWSLLPGDGSGWKTISTNFYHTTGSSTYTHIYTDIPTYTHIYPHVATAG